MFFQNVSAQVASGFVLLPALQARNLLLLSNSVLIRHMISQLTFRSRHKIAFQALHASREVHTNVIQEERLAVKPEAAEVAEKVFELLVNALDVLSQVCLELAANWTILTAQSTGRNGRMNKLKKECDGNFYLRFFENHRRFHPAALCSLHIILSFHHFRWCRRPNFGNLEIFDLDFFFDDLWFHRFFLERIRR